MARCHRPARPQSDSGSGVPRSDVPGIPVLAAGPRSSCAFTDGCLLGRRHDGDRVLGDGHRIGRADARGGDGFRPKGRTGASGLPRRPGHSARRRPASPRGYRRHFTGPASRKREWPPMTDRLAANRQRRGFRPLPTLTERGQTAFGHVPGCLVTLQSISPARVPTCQRRDRHWLVPRSPAPNLRHGICSGLSKGVPALLHRSNRRGFQCLRCSVSFGSGQVLILATLRAPKGPERHVFPTRCYPTR